MAVFSRLHTAGLRYWTTNGTQRVLFVTGTLLCGVMLFHLAALRVTGGPLTGPVSLRKPATFAETGWLMCWSVAWAIGVLGLGRGVRRIIAFGTALFGTTETAWVGAQAWRGVPSHYKYTTALDRTLFLVEGGVAGVFFVTMIVLLVAAARARGVAPSLRLSILAGTVMVIVGCAMGILMASNMSGIWEGAFFSNLPRGGMGSYRGPPAGLVGGDLVLLHAMGLHGLMLIPLAAWLLTHTAVPETTRTRLTAAVAAANVGITAVLAAQVFRVRPVERFDAFAVVLLAALGATLVVLYLGIAARAVRDAVAPSLPRGMRV